MPRAHALPGGSLSLSQNTSFKIASINGPGANEFQAMGNARMKYMRTNNGEGLMRNSAMKLSGTSEGAPTTVVPIISEHETAQEFSAVILPFSIGELAQAAKRGKEAAKKWKEGRSLPSAWSMMNMAREIPAVRNYLLIKLGLSAHMNFNSPQGMDALVQAVNIVSTLQGPDGDALRLLLATGGRR